MLRTYPCLLALILSAGGSLRAQEADTANDASTPEFAASYWTFGGMYRAADRNEYDIMLFAGQSWPLNDGGGWTLRGGLGAGVVFWALNDTGLLGGLQLALERTLTGDRIQLNDGRPLEIYAVAGGSGYAGWKLPEAPQATKLVPAVSAGLGVRVRGDEAHEPMVRLELYYEERFADFEPRLFIRLDYLSPRGVQRPSSP